MWTDRQIAGLEAFLENAVTSRMVPGVVAQIGQGETVIATASAGHALIHGGAPRTIRADTIFDLASLTKVIVTLPLILRLAQSGQMALGDAVSAYIPEFSGGAKDAITVSQLLSHSSGLLPHREYFRTLSGYAEIFNAAVQEPLISEPGTTVAYSDLGFILLGEIVQRVRGQSLTDAAQEEIFDVVGMQETGFRPGQALAHRIAATEVMPDGQAKVGVVHDDNTEAMGGVSGHAGLFASVNDIGRYLKMWVNPTATWLTAATRRAAVVSRTGGLNGHRGWGWVLRADGQDTLGDFWPPTAATHTGYTGTSIGFDVHERIWCVLLTNRVHFGRDHDITAFRRRFHNIVMTGFGNV